MEAGREGRSCRVSADDGEESPPPSKDGAEIGGSMDWGLVTEDTDDDVAAFLNDGALPLRSRGSSSSSISSYSDRASDMVSRNARRFFCLLGWTSLKWKTGGSGVDETGKGGDDDPRSLPLYPLPVPRPLT